MPRTQLFRKLEARVRDKVKSVGDTILGGAPESYEDYKYWVGYLRGLEDALEIADEIEGELD